MPDAYANLSRGEKLRVDAHLYDHLRDNRDGFFDNVVRLLRTELNRPNVTPAEAAVTVSRLIRNDLAGRVDQLSGVQSENITMDLQIHGSIDRHFREIAEGITYGRGYLPEHAPIRSAIDADLARIDAGRDLSHVSGSNLRIPAARDSRPTNLDPVADRAEQARMSNLTEQYGAAAARAAVRVQTRANDDYAEARLLKVGIDSINDNWLNHSYETVFNEARRAMQRAGASQFTDAELDNMTHAAVQNSTNRDRTPDGRSN